ncbi:DNA polymerase ligase-domain-containing protein [Phyllosticta citricarpa]|uniref:DNA polymerase ligase-domain-containing protein n=1 Tax=Phyllosticta citricarpa TaxID=55181 RepID=A0ABR1MF16_9PEZI
MSKAPSSLTRSISPPTPPRKRTRLNLTSEARNQAPNTSQTNNTSATSNSNSPGPAAIEAGEAKIDDHLAYFSTHLAAVSRCEPSAPRLSMDEFAELYRRNDRPHGCHFVVHQHDHPVSGPHYDLRLQFSESSSVSFALPYGLPGNPHSKKPTRMALETRVHCLWNHLIESASHATGSLLIWDTGEYEVLDQPSPTAGDETDSSTLSSNDLESTRAEAAQQPQNERLIDAFQKSRITLRLHGTRLPPNYTINMWLPSANRNPRGAKKNPPTQLPIRCRHRRRGNKYTTLNHHKNSTRTSTSMPRPPPPASIDPDSDSSDSSDPGALVADQDVADEEALDKYAEDDDDDGEEAAAAIRAANAYTGATNSIGSVHSRQWYVSLNKALSGLPVASSTTSSSLSSAESTTKKINNEEWEWGDAGGAFLVHGPEIERSVVTGRLAADVMADEGVAAGFVPRRGWRAVLS